MNVVDNGTRTLRIHYYALLREERGLREESLSTSAATVRDLYDELRTRHGFSLGPDMLRVVINEEFRDWDAPLREGDSLVFIPPVAGG